MSDNVQVEPSVFERLREPFMPSELEWKVQTFSESNGRALTLVYIDARAVMDRLDSAVGPENWRDEYHPAPQGGVMCTLSIRINGEWVSKTDGAENTDVEAIKGGFSDSFKRAAVKWGIGRYLYNFPKVWCSAEKVGKMVLLNERPAVPEWAYPADYQGEKEKGMVILRNVPDSSPHTAPAKKEGKPQAAPAKQETTAAPAATLTEEQERYNKAAAYVVPSNLPLAGKTLGEVVKDEKLGLAVVRFLAGAAKNKAGKEFVPSTEDETRLQNAAKYVLQQLALD